ncbi:hypothetical protein BDR26DRAFT_893079 [Obelidium mucronatum]|nr:hypothetical protein BDR26DRAFT_893079 [Obelidium mucronatum]
MFCCCCARRSHVQLPAYDYDYNDNDGDGDGASDGDADSFGFHGRRAEENTATNAGGASWHWLARLFRRDGLATPAVARAANPRAPPPPPAPPAANANANAAAAEPLLRFAGDGADADAGNADNDNDDDGAISHAVALPAAQNLFARANSSNAFKLSPAAKQLLIDEMTSGFANAAAPVSHDLIDIGGPTDDDPAFGHWQQHPPPTSTLFPSSSSALAASDLFSTPFSSSHSQSASLQPATVPQPILAFDSNNPLGFIDDDE